MAKFFFRFFIGLCISVFFIILIEALYFVWILNIDNSVTPSDAILIFKGSEKRTETGYRLANQGVALRIVLSPASEAHLQKCAKKFQLRETVTSLYENQARTTFENALYTSRIIKSNKFRSVTLVTSDYHMPRSLALLRLLLTGHGVKIHIHQVKNRETGGWALLTDSFLMEIIYNEMVEFWGSLLEFFVWRITSEQTDISKDSSAVSSFLRSAMLFEIEPSW